MIIQQLRLEKGWSQQQLSEISGVSGRTIQRVESGQSCSMETLKSLVAAFDVDYLTLYHGVESNNDADGFQKTQGVAGTSQRRRFYRHMALYVLFCILMLVLAFMRHRSWPLWAMAGWGVGVWFHGYRAIRHPSHT